jgi:hypothetical protein
MLVHNNVAGLCKLKVSRNGRACRPEGAPHPSAHAG